MNKITAILGVWLLFQIAGVSAAQFGCARVAVDNCVTTPVTTTVGSTTTTTTTETCTWKYECYDTSDPSTLKNTCSPTDISGGLRVTAGELSACIQTAGVANPTCISWKDEYAFPEKAVKDNSSCVITPYPLAGPVESACSLRGRGAHIECSGWMARTLSDSECRSIYVDAGGAENNNELDFRDKPGCGFCIKPVMEDTCYADPVASRVPADTCSIDTSKCTLSSSSCIDATGSLCITQKESYSCTNSERICLEEKISSSCADSDTSDMSHGMATPTLPVPASNLGSAMAGAAVLNAVGTDTAGTPIVPRIFGGEDKRCSKPTGFFSELLANDCCRENLQRPGGNRPSHACTIEDVKLAAARRAKRTVTIGTYCSKKKRFFGCTRKTTTFCAFSSLLARIVQEQGRAQLDLIATSGTGNQTKQTVSFPYYDSTTNGAWQTLGVMNGVQVESWKWPSYCSSAESASAYISQNGDANECPSVLTQWFLTCDNPKGCGAKPQTPFFDQGEWILQQVDPLTNKTSAISKYAVAVGACDPTTSTCTYNIAAWPAGIGGKAVLTRELSFYLFAGEDSWTPVALDSPSQVSGTPALSDTYGSTTTAGDFVFRPHSFIAKTGQMPATTKLDYSIDGGGTWKTYDLPTRLTGTEVTLPDSDIRISGECDAFTYLCLYRITGTSAIASKPWGSPQSPDCTGFTVGQISALDFGKMDLSEWVSSIMGKVSTTTAASDLANLAKSQTQDFYEVFQEEPGVTVKSSVSNARSATLRPMEEYGPFTVTLQVVGNWPQYFSNPAENKDPISSILVDWGDCSPAVAYSRTRIVDDNGKEGFGFKVTHAYASPDKVAAACGGGERNITHNVSITVTSATGTHRLNAKVKNVWSDYDNSFGSSGQTPINSSADATAEVPGTGSANPYLDVIPEGMHQ